MKPMRWITTVMMLLIAFGAAAQEEFFDDVYFSTPSKSKSEKAEKKEVVVLEPEEANASSEEIFEQAEWSTDNDRDVDEYNRRYSGDADEATEAREASAEEVEADDTDKRRSDMEYSERIVRYHSPSKITIAGADEINLYLSDGYVSLFLQCHPFTFALGFRYLFRIFLRYCQFLLLECAILGKVGTHGFGLGTVYLLDLFLASFGGQFVGAVYLGLLVGGEAAGVGGGDA